MAKYHITPDGPKPCRATKRACKYGSGEHYENQAEAHEEFAKQLRAKEGMFKTNKRTKSSRLKDTPITIKPAPPYKVEDIHYKIDVYSNSQITDSHRYCEEEGICRCTVVEGLEAHWTDTPEDYIRKIFDVDENTPLDKELNRLASRYSSAQDFVDDCDWNAKNGYYGEELEYVHSPRIVEQVIEQKYWDQPNASDKNGVLNYIRGKGFDTTGLNPLSAVKESLKDENNGIEPSIIKNASNVEVEDLSSGEILIDNPHHLRKCEESYPSVPYGIQSESVAGVLYKDEKGYHLVDGYHRHKYIVNNSSSDSKNKYIVLS